MRLQRRLTHLALALLLLGGARAWADDRSVKVITDQSAVVMTATATGTGWLVERYTEAVVYVDVTAESGTVTLGAVVQSSPDNSIWATHTTFTQITAVSTNVKYLTNLGRYVRIVYTIGGTTSFTVTSKIALKT
jgi:hypothetical protein